MCCANMTDSVGGTGASNRDVNKALGCFHIIAILAQFLKPELGADSK